MAVFLLASLEKAQKRTGENADPYEWAQKATYIDK